MNKKRLLSGTSLLIICMLITVLSRAILLGEYPGGTNADEAFSGYEAWSVLNYGTDSWGYPNPVYFTVWGSGMSVLNSYLMIPFIKMWGLNIVTIRVPQMLFGVLTVFVLYFLVKRTSNERTALCAAFLLAISPWHIMTTRYGMDANLAPAFIILGIYFGVLGLEKNWCLIFSALFWGLSLYTYAAIWTFVPVFLAAAIAYCLYIRQLKISGWLAAAVAVLFLTALPLLLFVAVNIELIPEIRTSFISIPKLVQFRGDEVNIRDLPSNIILALKLFVSQNDHNIWNSIPYFGVYYLFSTPFIVIGGITAVRNVIKSFRERAFSYEFLLLLWIMVAAVFAVLQRTNLNRINAIHMAMFILLAKGIVWCCEKLWKYLKYVMVVLYGICFIAFEAYYFTAYQDIISERQLAGADAALARANELYEAGSYEKIFITGQLRHSQVLLYVQYPTDRYIEEVEWKNYPDKYLIAQSFANYYWNDEDEEPNEKGIYVIRKAEKEEFEKYGYVVEAFAYCGVAYKK